MRKNNVLKEKSFAFALRIIKLYQFLKTEQKEYVLSRQILRCGTSVGACIRESENAASRKDFIHKLTIALKEADETQYWLELLCKSDFLENKLYVSLVADCNELVSMLVSSIKTLKAKELL
jgi:four helix bundle protein